MCAFHIAPLCGLCGAGCRTPDRCVILAVWQRAQQKLGPSTGFSITQQQPTERESSGRGRGDVMWKIICRTDATHQFFLLPHAKFTGSLGVFVVVFSF